MGFETDKHYNKDIHIGVTNYGYPSINLRVSHWLRANDVSVTSVFILNYGSLRVQCPITPAEARQFAANLLAHADEVEAHQVELVSQTTREADHAV